MARDVEHIHAPTLLVWGADDRILPLGPTSEPSKRFPRAQLHVFERCGHVAMYEKPDAFNALALALLADVRPPRAPLRADSIVTWHHRPPPTRPFCEQPRRMFRV